MVTPPNAQMVDAAALVGGVTPPQELLLQGGVYSPRLRISVAAAAPWSALPLVGDPAALQDAIVP